MSNFQKLVSPYSLIVAVLIATLYWSAAVIAQDALTSGPQASPRALSYGDRRGMALDTCKQGCRSVIHDHWWVDLPSLPGQRSNLIVEGTTSDCGVDLSSDKTTTFTACGAEVEKVIKNSTTNRISEASKIIVTREGGDIGLNGAKVGSVIAGQSLPQSETRYILFLRYRPPTDDYTILAYYRVTGQGIQAVDEPPLFHVHDGKKEDEFLNDVQTSTVDEKQFLRHHVAGGAN
jgi:hypothetical protein